MKTEQNGVSIVIPAYREAENIEAAKAIGMQTLHFTDPDVAQQQLAAITGVV